MTGVGMVTMCFGVGLTAMHSTVFYDEGMEMFFAGCPELTRQTESPRHPTLVGMHETGRTMDGHPSYSIGRYVVGTERSGGRAEDREGIDRNDDTDSDSE